MSENGHSNHTNGFAPVIKPGADPDVESDADFPADGLTADAPASNAPLHNITRHPNDPPRALENAATEVCDPETVREYAVGVGVTTQAITDEQFSEHVDKHYLGLTAVRAGAITGPAAAAIGDQEEIVESTEPDVDEIRASRGADFEKAKRLSGDALTRARLDVVKAEEKVEQAATKVEEITDDLTDARQQPEAKPDRKPDIAERVPISPRHVAVIAVFDVLANAVFVEPAIGKLVTSTVPFASFLIAMALSTMIIVGSAVAGYGLSMVRLPGRAVGVLACGAFALILAKFIGGLDLLRETNEAGLKALTAATMAASFVAMFTAYTITVRRAWLAELAALVGEGTTVGTLMERLDRAKEALSEAIRLRDAAIVKCDALLDQIEALFDSAARVGAATAARESARATASVRIKTIGKVADIQVDQEVGANMVWAVAAAWLARLKTRAEELPKPDAAQATMPVERDMAVSIIDKIARIAIGVLAAGLLLGALLGSVPVVVGASIALVLMLLAACVPVIKRRKSAAEAPPEPPEPLVITPTIDSDNPFYRYQPDHTTAKYRSGDTGPSERN